MFWKKKNLIANVIEDKCRNCRCCVRVCRHHALETAEVQGQIVTFVNHPEKCTACGKCVTICPNQAIEMIKRYV